MVSRHESGHVSAECADCDEETEQWSSAELDAIEAQIVQLAKHASPAPATGSIVLFRPWALAGAVVVIVVGFGLGWWLSHEATILSTILLLSLPFGIAFSVGLSLTARTSKR